MPLSSLLRTGDLSHAINFAIRHYNKQTAATYNISVNDRKANSFFTPSTVNVLSDNGTSVSYKQCPLCNNKHSTLEAGKQHSNKHRTFEAE